MASRALLSVSDKTGLVPFAKALTDLGWEIISTGGTAKALLAAKIPVTTVEDVTGFPECFGGRVKTMHPMIMGGVLFRRDNADDVKKAKELKIDPIDLVVVNLYPFVEGRAKNPDGDHTELIDIGGPTLLRSAAKNHAHVTVVTDPADYDRVIEQLKKKATTPELRKELAAKVFLHTAAYDAAITEWLSQGKNTGVVLTNGETLRYGENPHQWGKYYAKAGSEEGKKAKGKNDLLPSCPPALLPSSWGAKHQGKELSYLNILDTDAAWEAVNAFTDPTAVFVKHANPSGIATRKNIDDAFQAAYDADRLSAFGVIIALNRKCTAVIAQKIIDQKMFVEVIVASEYEPEALEILKQKPNIRVIEQQAVSRKGEMTYRSVLGGFLVQNIDDSHVTAADLKVVTKKQPTPEQISDLLFAWNCVKYCKSNAIAFVKDKVTVGLGTGQTSRVDSTWIAAKRAGEKAKGAVMASDAFFPFPDSVEEAARHGIAAIIQPGGSIRDAEVFAKADELGIVMVLTGIRAFRH